jgi:type III secretion system chaperone SycN
MSQFAEVIKAFGQMLGVQNLSLNAQGIVQLKMESGITYALEETTEVLLVQLLFPVSTFDGREIKKRLLLLTDYRKRKNKPFYVLRYSSESLILQMRLHPEELSVQSLEQSMEYLMHCVEYARGHRAML